MIVRRGPTEKPRPKTGPSAVRHSSFALVLWGLCLCILALRTTYTESPIAQATISPGDLTDTVYSLTLSGLLIFALVAWLVRGLLAGRIAYRLTGIEVGLALFIAACAISTIAAGNQRLAITQTVILLAPILAAILLVQLLDTSSKIRLTLIVVAALGIVSAYRSTEQIRTNEWMIEAYEEDPEGFLRRHNISFEIGSFQHFLWEHRLYSRGVAGYFTTGNTAASFALMASLVAFALLLEQARSGDDKKLRSRYALFRAAGVVFIVAGLLLTRSKGGIIGLFLAAALLGILFHGRTWPAARRKLAVAIALPLILILIVGIGYAGISYGIEHGRLPGGNSMLVRWQYWVASMQMFRDHPLAGVGPGNFAQNYTRYKPAAAPESVADPHSLPLSLLTQYGPLGLAGFLVMVLIPIWRSIRSGAGDAGDDREDYGAASAKPCALALLGAVCVTLLVLRPILIPMSAGDEIILAMYQIIVFYVAPVAAFLIGFLLLSAPLTGGFSKKGGTGNAIISLTLGCAVFGVLIHNLVDFAIFEPGVWMAFWLVMACLIASRRPRQIQLSAISSQSKTIVSFLALALLVVFWQYVWRPAYQVTTYVQRAYQAALMGRFDSAHRLVETARQADPLNPVPLSVGGHLYVQHYEATFPKEPALLEEAARSLHQAIEANPTDYKAYERLGLVYTTLERHQDAYEWYTQVVERYPGSGRLWLQRAQAAEQIGKLDVALAAYSRAVQIEDAYRRQFRQMYPEREEVVSRIGEDNYRFAKERIAELSV